MKVSFKTFLTYAVLIILSLAFLVVGANICDVETTDEQYERHATAKVTEILAVEEIPSALGGEGNHAVEVSFNAKITSGEFKGKTVHVLQYIDTAYSYQQKQIENGDAVILVTYENGADADLWEFAEYNRLPWLIALVAIFFLLIIIIGKIKGVGTVLSLVLTALAVLCVYIPGILKGYNIYLLTVIVSVFTVVMSLVMLNGISKKTLCACVGNVGGIFAAALLALIFTKAMYITGILDESYIYLTYMDIPIDLTAVVWGGTVIGAVGAVMDVSIEIASSINELNENMAQKSFSAMFKSGLNIGKDAIGTMTNTLILAYVGCSLSTLLLATTYSKDLLYLINTEMIAVELIQALIGSIGILMAVPLTTLVSAYVYNKGKTKIKKEKKTPNEESAMTDDEFWSTRS